MKYKITIVDENSQVLFQGKPIGLPMKKQAVVDKCIDLFSDPEPCVIHESYAAQKLADDFVALFPDLPLIRFSLSNYKKKLDYINIPHIEKCYLTIEVKS